MNAPRLWQLRQGFLSGVRGFLCLRLEIVFIIEINGPAALGGSHKMGDRRILQELCAPLFN